jgi:hypothetical protein
MEERIVVNPKIMVGKPIISGTRIHYGNKAQENINFRFAVPSWIRTET